MRNPALQYLIVLSLALLMPSVGAAESTWYGSVGFGYQFVDADVVPLGSNIAVDPDFPQTWDLDDVPSLDLGLGYVVHDRLRIELSYTVTEYEADATNIGTGARDGFAYNVRFESDIETLMLEAHWDLTTGDSFRPFLKVGAGSSSADSTASIDSSNDPLFEEILGPAGFLNAEGRYPYDGNSTDDFSWLVGIGVRWTLTERLQLGAVAQRVELGDPATASDPFTDAFGVPDLSSNEVRLSLEIGF